MKPYRKHSISERLSLAKHIFVIAQSDAEISSVLADFGFTTPRFSDGVRRLEVASKRETDQRAQLGAQVMATHIVNDLFASMLRKFRTDRRIAQTVLIDNPELYEGLRLHLTLNRSKAGFIRQAIHFYQEITAHEEVMTALGTEYNLNEAVFTARQAELDAFLEARRMQQLMKGNAQVATQKRRAAMEALDEYMIQLIGVAKLAFRNNERQLRKLGLAVALRD